MDDRKYTHGRTARARVPMLYIHGMGPLIYPLSRIAIGGMVYKSDTFLRIQRGCETCNRHCSQHFLRNYPDQTCKRGCQEYGQYTEEDSEVTAGFLYHAPRSHRLSSLLFSMFGIR